MKKARAVCGVDRRWLSVQLPNNPSWWYLIVSASTPTTHALPYPHHYPPHPHHRPRPHPHPHLLPRPLLTHTVIHPLQLLVPLSHSFIRHLLLLLFSPTSSSF